MYTLTRLTQHMRWEDPGTLDHTCSFDNPGRTTLFLYTTQSPKKHWKIPITQSYLLSFHGVFIQGLCQNLTIHCRTMQHNPDPLDPCRAPAPELEHINSSNTTMGHFIWIFASSDWTGQGSHDPKTECAALPT